MYIASSVLRRPPLRRLRCVVCRRLLRLFRDHSFFSLTLRQQVDIRKQEVRSRDRFPPWTEANQTLEMGFLGCQVCDRESKAEEEARGRAAKARMSSNNDNADCNVCAPHPCTLAGSKRSKSTEVSFSLPHPHHDLHHHHYHHHPNHHEGEQGPVQVPLQLKLQLRDLHWSLQEERLGLPSTM